MSPVNLILGESEYINQFNKYSLNFSWWVRPCFRIVGGEMVIKMNKSGHLGGSVS